MSQNKTTDPKTYPAEMQTRCEFERTWIVSLSSVA